MANTLTLEEFNRIKLRTNEITYENIVNYHDSKTNGLECNPDPVRELFLYSKTINTWEQDEYNSINFTNYLNSNDIQFIYNRINELS